MITHLAPVARARASDMARQGSIQVCEDGVARGRHREDLHLKRCGERGGGGRAANAFDEDATRLSSGCLYPLLLVERTLPIESVFGKGLGLLTTMPKSTFLRKPWG